MPKMPRCGSRCKSRPNQRPRKGQVKGTGVSTDTYMCISSHRSEPGASPPTFEWGGRIQVPKPTYPIFFLGFRPLNLESLGKDCFSYDLDKKIMQKSKFPVGDVPPEFPTGGTRPPSPRFRRQWSETEHRPNVQEQIHFKD